MQAGDGDWLLSEKKSRKHLIASSSSNKLLFSAYLENVYTYIKETLLRLNIVFSACFVVLSRE